MGEIFCVEFQSYPLKFHTKYLTHTLKDMILYNIEILRAHRFKSSYVFLKNKPHGIAITMHAIVQHFHTWMMVMSEAQRHHCCSVST